MYCLANITILHLSLTLHLQTFNNQYKPTMKNFFLLLASAAILISCGGNKENKSGDSITQTYATDMENVDSLATIVPATWKNLETLTDTLAHSGKYSSKIDSVREFSLVYENKLGNMNNSLPKKVKITAFGCSLQPGSKGLIVCSINNNKFYAGAVVDSVFTNTNEWKEISAEFSFPEGLTTDDVMKAYVWNKKAGVLLIDDLKLEMTY